ncbi:MAG: peptidoglycan DD-metalloendopeptidase family protein [Gammaproteobacteria bacterium]|nr:peptidoglycan DD-metalloendopeptidase family protein [Gammaproteobacteria bacterium]
MIILHKILRKLTVTPDRRSLIPLFTLALTFPVFADTSTTKKIELHNLNKNIASIQTDLNQASLKKSQLQDALAKTETIESQINRKLNASQKQLMAQQNKIQQLKEQAIPLANAKNQNHSLLKEQIRDAYLFSQQPAMKLLLSPDDVMQTQRTLMYFHYITSAQVKTMTQLQNSLIACQQNQQAIQKHYATLLLLKQKQLKNQQALKAVQGQRQQLIQAVNQHIQTNSQKLKKLLQNKQQLESTIQQLNTATSKQRFISNKPFSQLRGKLPWPTQGHIIHAFGAQISQSELTWDGTVIAAPLGQSVRAIASGRVIFAKWMAGYGLLLIINDGNGYMTLYGRNQTLLTAVGNTVKAGDAIATVGKSGGFLQPALYFSIRYNGKVVNPGTWCH